MSNKYVLILISLNFDKRDLGGHLFPESGYVEADDYKLNKDILQGLYGTLWGQTKGSRWLNTDPLAQWKIVKTRDSDEIVILDKEYNFVKFHHGMVVESGTRHECMEYIRENGDFDEYSDLIAAKIESHGTDDHVFMSGFDSTAITESAVSHAINTGEESVARTAGTNSCAIVTSIKSEATTIGDYSSAITSRPNSSVNALGINSNAVALEGHSSLISGVGGVSVALEPNCRGMVDDDGILILTYEVDGHRRIKVGYAGEEIQPHKVYRLNTKGEFEEIIS